MSASDRALDPRGPLLAAVLWAGMWLVTSGLAAAQFAVGLIGLVGLAWAWPRKAWLLAALGSALLACVLAGGVRVWMDQSGPVHALADEGAVVTVQARLLRAGTLTEERFGGTLWQGVAHVESIQARGRTWKGGALIRLTAGGDSVSSWVLVAPGSTIRTIARLELPDEVGALSAIARAREPPVLLTPPAWIDLAVERVHRGLRDAVATLPPEPRALVPALVVGDTSDMTGDLVDRFRATGLTHLTAVSGANLTLLLSSLLWAASRLGLRGWWLRISAALGVLAFVVLCRGEPSVLRAAAMGTLGLVALGWGGKRQGLRYLSWAVVGLLLADPWLSRSIGFTLSTFATAGIIWWSAGWTRILAGWMPVWLAEAVAVPVAAQLATQPIVTAVSGQLSVVGILANVVAGPLVGPGTVFGFLAAGLSLVVPPAAAVAGWLAGWCAQGLCWIALLGTAFPGAAVRWPVTPAALAVMTFGCLVLPVVLTQALRRRWLVFVLAVALLAALLRPVPQPGWPPTGWQFVVCDVGQGDASVVRVAPGQAIVVDSGPEPKAVNRCLDDLGVSMIPLLVLTHLHADHIGGLAGIVAGRQVGRLLTSGVRVPASGWTAVEGVLAPVPHLTATPGLTLTLGSASVEVLAVRPFTSTSGQGEGESSDENDGSVVIRARTSGLTVLIAGDVEESGQANALASAPELHSDVLLVPHHGSSRQNPGFLPACGPRVAVISVGEGNEYGHPAAGVVRDVQAAGAVVYRTDQNGSVAVVRDPAGFAVVTVQRRP